MNHQPKQARLYDTDMYIPCCGGSWPISIHREPSTDTDYIILVEGMTMWISGGFRTKGLAIGYLKRLGRTQPYGKSRFHLIPWLGSWSVYVSTEEDKPSQENCKVCGKPYDPSIICHWFG